MRNNLDAATMKELLPIVQQHEPSFVYLFEPQPRLAAVEVQYRNWLRKKIVDNFKSLKLIEEV